VRIALGARPAAVVLMIVRQGMVYVLVGIGVGIVRRGGPLVPCCLPAAKAARVDPVVALRQDEENTRTRPPLSASRLGAAIVQRFQLANAAHHFTSRQLANRGER
jgi:hypothetical protein